MIVCGWCRSEQLRAHGAIYCSRKCRQSAFRLRRRVGQDLGDAKPGHFAYADPPYPGLAKRYYQGEPSFAGEVNHAELVASLEARGYTGWALSTSAKALRDVLPLCPARARVCAWVKPIGAAPATFGLHNTWEPLIVVGGRQRRPGKRDWLSAQPARHGGTLPGRKPLAFAAWLFQCLGMVSGDVLDDVFPGTGVIGRAWDSLSSAAGAGRRLSPLQHDDATAGVSPVHDDDASELSPAPAASRPGAGDSAAVAGVLL